MNADQKINWLRERVAVLTVQRNVLRHRLWQQKGLYRHYPVKCEWLSTEYESMRQTLHEDALIAGLHAKDATIEVHETDDGKRLMRAIWDDGREIICIADPEHPYARETSDEHEAKLAAAYERKTAPKIDTVREMLGQTRRVV